MLLTHVLSLTCLPFRTLIHHSSPPLTLVLSPLCGQGHTYNGPSTCLGHLVDLEITKYPDFQIFVLPFFLSFSHISPPSLPSLTTDACSSEGVRQNTRTIDNRKTRYTALSTVYCSLSTVDCLLCTVHCSLYTVHCSLYTMPGSLYTVPCSLYIVHCTLCTVHCILCPVHCTLCIVHCSGVRLFHQGGGRR